MSEIIYYESEDSKIVITDSFIHIFHCSYKVKEVKESEGFFCKPDQTVNLALAFLGIVCVVLGKIRGGQLSQIVDINIFFSASNYFDLLGLIFILIALLITLPQKEFFAIKLKMVNGSQKTIMLSEKKYAKDIGQINKAIKQALRYQDFKTNIS